MTQHEALISEIEKRGGSITTAEILELRPHISQYGRVIKDLREKGYVILCKPILNQKKNNLFTLTAKPGKKEWNGSGVQRPLFGTAA